MNPGGEELILVLHLFARWRFRASKKIEPKEILDTIVISSSNKNLIHACMTLRYCLS